MKKIKLIKYDKCYLYATDECMGLQGYTEELQALLSAIVSNMKEQGLSEEEIMMAVNVGLKGKDYLLSELEKIMKKTFDKMCEITKEEEKPKKKPTPKKTTKKEGKK